MKELNYIIGLLYSKKPKYYIDIVSVDTGEVVKNKYSYTEIFTELSMDEGINNWFDKLLVNEFQVSLFLRNGSSWKKKETYYINTEQERLITAPTTEQEPSQYLGLKGSEVPKLLANEILYSNLKTDFLKLETENEKQQTQIKKLENKLKKTKTKLLFSNLDNNKKSFLETEVGQGLVGAIPQILESLAPVIARRGLNAAATEEVEKLTGQQKAFMEFIKTLSDKEIVEINTLYKQYLKEKKIVENQAQTNEQTL